MTPRQRGDAPGDVVIYLACNGPATAKQVAEEISMPLSTAHVTMHRLCDNGLATPAPVCRTPGKSGPTPRAVTLSPSGRIYANMLKGNQ